MLTRSRAKDEVAVSPMAAAKSMMRIMTTITVVPAWLWVALKKTWMNGCPVGVLNTLSRSPTQKMKVAPMMMNIAAFGRKDHTRVRGTVCEASFTSSALREVSC